MPPRIGQKMRQLIAGNWKMNGLLAEAMTLSKHVAAFVSAEKRKHNLQNPVIETCCRRIVKINSLLHNRLILTNYSPT